MARIKKNKVKAKAKTEFKLQGKPFLFRSTVLLKKDGEDEVINDDKDKGEDKEDGSKVEQGLHKSSFGFHSESDGGKD
jgi:hypothetical protein